MVSAKQVHMTWTDDASMNEDKPCLQRDVTEVDVSRCRKNMLDVCYDPTLYDEYRAMVERGNEYQGKATCRYTVTFVTAVCYAEVLFQPVFLA